MKLNDENAKTNDAATMEELNGKKYYALEVTYDPAVGKDNWFST